VGRTHQGARFVVCLSGGLDSTIVAGLAARYLPHVTAASFSFLPADQANVLARGDVAANSEVLSDDFRKAYVVAQRLGVNFLPVLRLPSAVAEALPVAVRLGQDWRDFNVHAAVVNVFLAQELRACFGGEKVVVLTGDIMNELVCDYRAEVVDGQVYYPQPRVGLARRRRFFVRGLDAGDREMGVFTGYGLDLCQPYAAVAHHYMTVPARLLEKEDAKWNLNAHMLPDAVRDVVTPGKTRAQVGGKDQGVLGLYHRLGIRQNDLERLWCRQVSQAADRTALDLIQFGRYRLADEK
jgi:asparagine synthetase B (glutamine-hydrolysing)